MISLILIIAVFGAMGAAAAPHGYKLAAFSAAVAFMAYLNSDVISLFVERAMQGVCT